MARRVRTVLSLAAVLAVTALALAPLSPAAASDPEESTLTVPSSPGSAESAWTGTVQPGTNPSSECTLPQDQLSQDSHALTVDVPDLGDGLTYNVKFEITWEPAAQVSDLILTVLDADGNVVANSDGGSPEEAATVAELPAGTYTVVACPWVNEAPQDYDGRAIATTSEAAAVDLPPPADAQGLAFSAAVPADIQRDEGEPLIEIAPDGRMYTCGPTGFSQAEDYWQVSEDGGDQFHLLGEPPRGQQSLGGGGDCALAISPTPNDNGSHQISYVGLSGLLEFATSTSPDGGKTLTSNAFSLVGAGVDRQWTVATDPDTVLLNFNRVAPQRQTEVCLSTDAGLTYPGCQAVSPNPGFPGPMRSIPAEQNPHGDAPIVYYPWSQGTAVRLAVSLDGGTTWNNCTAVEAEGSPDTLFPVMDHDAPGENIYLAYVDQANYVAYMNHAAVADLDGCQGGTTADDAAIKDNPGFSDPVTVSRGDIITSTHPWIAAGAEPGRVAVTFYGTNTPGPADQPDEKTWHVYVNQSLNALSANPDFSQVRATTHPNHYDQICLFGLACTASADRSLVDFFAIDYNPVNGELAVVFNRAHKRPGDTAGLVSTPLVFRQISGPSLGGGTVSLPDREPVRSVSSDPTEDALADYSSLFAPPTTTNIPAMDITNVEILPPVDPESGEAFEDGGVTVRATIDDLSDGALSEAMADTAAPTPAGVPAQSLLYIFRMVDGYRYSAAVASYNPGSGFRFGYGEYTGNPGECVLVGQEGEGDQCLLYPGGTTIPGSVDADAGTITMTIPLEFLTALSDVTPPPGETPEEVAAQPGDRIYTAGMFTQANYASPDSQIQSWLQPIDNAPAFDFLIPEVPSGPISTPPPPGAPGDGTDDGDGGAPDDGDGSDDGAGSGVTPTTGGGVAGLALVLLLGAGVFAALRRRT